MELALQLPVEPSGVAPSRAKEAHTADRGRGRTPDFEACVHSLAVALLDELGMPSSHGHEPDAVADYLLATCREMPDYLRVAVRAATLAIDALPYVTSGKPFHSLDLSRQVRLLRRLDRLPIGPLRSVIAFYRALSVYARFAAADARRI